MVLNWRKEAKGDSSLVKILGAVAKLNGRRCHL